MCWPPRLSPTCTPLSLRFGGRLIEVCSEMKALITLITLLLYNLVQIVENIVLTRMGMTPGAR